MAKRSKYLSVKTTDNTITLNFNPMFAVTAVRRATPPPTKVEPAKKGKGSYNRKAKHKKRYHGDDSGSSFYFFA